MSPNTDFFIKILSSSLNTMLIVVLLTNAAVTSAVMNFWCHTLIAKVNNQKNSDMKNFICNQYGERHTILSTENIEICGRITTLEEIRMQFVCIFFHIGWISAEIWIYNFARYCRNTPKVMWAMTYGFCSKFHTLSAVQIFWESVKIWQSYTEFKGGNFFETQCSLSFVALVYDRNKAYYGSNVYEVAFWSGM